MILLSLPSFSSRSLTLDPVKTLPPELISIIFSYLPKASLDHCSLVNKEWKDFSRDSLLWYPNYAFLIQNLSSHYVIQQKPNYEDPFSFVQKVMVVFPSLMRRLDAFCPGICDLHRNPWSLIKPVIEGSFSDSSSIESAFQSFQEAILRFLRASEKFKLRWGVEAGPENFYHYSIEFVQFLQEKPCEADLLLGLLVKNSQTLTKETQKICFFLALARAKKEIIEEVLKSKEGNEEFQNYRLSVVRCACFSGDLSFVKYILSCFSDQDFPDMIINDLVKFAAQFGHLEFLNELLDPSKIDAFTKDSFPIDFAMKLASENGHEECLKSLLNYREKIKEPPYFEFLFSTTIQKNRLACFKQLTTFFLQNPLFLYPDSTEFIQVYAEASHQEDPSFLEEFMKLFPFFENDLREELGRSVHSACFFGSSEAIKFLRELPNRKELPEEEFIKAFDSMGHSIFSSGISIGDTGDRRGCVQELKKFSNIKNISKNQLEKLFYNMISPKFSDCHEYRTPFREPSLSYHDQRLASLLWGLRDFTNIDEVSLDTLSSLMIILAQNGYSQSLQELKSYPQAENLSLVSWFRALLSASQKGDLTCLQILKDFPNVQKKILEGWNRDQENEINRDSRGCSFWRFSFKYEFETSKIKNPEPQKIFYSRILQSAKEKAQSCQNLSCVKELESFPTVSEIEQRNPYNGSQDLVSTSGFIGKVPPLANSGQPENDKQISKISQTPVIIEREEKKILPEFAQPSSPKKPAILSFLTYFMSIIYSVFNYIFSKPHLSKKKN